MRRTTWNPKIPQGPRIPHLIGPGGVTDCFRCHSGAPCRGMDSRVRGNDGGGGGPGGVMDCFRCHGGAPCRGWIPAFAGMTEVGDFG